MNNYVATIDLGTNTFHILIAELFDNQPFKTAYHERIPVMIGRGGINQGIITAEAIDRALAALTQFKSTLNSYQIPLDRVFCTATSAFRNAKNRQKLVERIKRETGIEVNIISGNQEAEYIFYGVQEAVPLSDENALIMDIGGGSVEFILCNRSKIIWKQSFEMGAQRLLDQFDIQDPISQVNITALQQHFSKTLQPLSEVIQQHHPEVLIGASGTFDTLSDIHVLQNNVAVPPNATELPLTVEAFEKMLQDFSHMNRSERLKIPGMIEMRVDMIVIAAWLIQFVLDTHSIYNIRISAYALKEGLITQLVERFS
ncbi:MAG: phosphatase [Bacteroidota bacterium]